MAIFPQKTPQSIHIPYSAQGLEVKAWSLSQYHQIQIQSHTEFEREKIWSLPRCKTWFSVVGEISLYADTEFWYFVTNAPAEFGVSCLSEISFMDVFDINESGPGLCFDWNSSILGTLDYWSGKKKNHFVFFFLDNNCLWLVSLKITTMYLWYVVCRGEGGITCLFWVWSVIGWICHCHAYDIGAGLDVTLCFLIMRSVWTWPQNCIC